MEVNKNGENAAVCNEDRHLWPAGTTPGACQCGLLLAYGSELRAEPIFYDQFTVEQPRAATSDVDPQDAAASLGELSLPAKDGAGLPEPPSPPGSSAS